MSMIEPEHGRSSFQDGQGAADAPRRTDGAISAILSRLAKLTGEELESNRISLTKQLSDVFQARRDCGDVSVALTDAALLLRGVPQAQLVFSVLHAENRASAEKIQPIYSALIALRESRTKMHPMVPDVLDKDRVPSLQASLHALMDSPEAVGYLVRYVLHPNSFGAGFVARELFNSSQREIINGPVLKTLRTLLGECRLAQNGIENDIQCQKIANNAMNNCAAAVWALDPRDPGVVELLKAGLLLGPKDSGNFDYAACRCLGLVRELDSSIDPLIERIAFDLDRGWVARKGAIEILSQQPDAAHVKKYRDLIQFSQWEMCRHTAREQGFRGLAAMVKSCAIFLSDKSTEQSLVDSQIAAALILERIDPNASGAALMRLTNDASSGKNKGSWFAHGDALRCLRRLARIPA